MRGMPECPVSLGWTYRIIPAYAGNACAQRLKLPLGTDHPRVCGECLPGDVDRLRGGGSSPRMRGMLLGPAHVLRPRRIIPAYAGNAAPTSAISTTSPDHPRVCGECAPAPVGQYGGSGSSPRMRGMHGDAVALEPLKRIIPAYAGNASSSEYSRSGSADHPRVCGECSNRDNTGPGMRGSSPRMRGMPMTIALASCNSRIIPAYAGNAPSKGEGSDGGSDHPRVCGECFADFLAVFLAVRIIPAYAGNA